MTEFYNDERNASSWSIPEPKVEEYDYNAHEYDYYDDKFFDINYFGVADDYFNGKYSNVDYYTEDTTTKIKSNEMKMGTVGTIYEELMRNMGADITKLVIAFMDPNCMCTSTTWIQLQHYYRDRYRCLECQEIICPRCADSIYPEYCTGSTCW